MGTAAHNCGDICMFLGGIAFICAISFYDVISDWSEALLERYRAKTKAIRGDKEEPE